MLVDVAEAGERLEERIVLTRRGDEVLLCRDGRPVAVLSASSGADERPVAASDEAGIDLVWDLAGKAEAPRPERRPSTAASTT